ncbi:MAG: S1C family serine protease, partial [Planctomycetota bacterium]
MSARPETQLAQLAHTYGKHHPLYLQLLAKVNAGAVGGPNRIAIADMRIGFAVADDLVIVGLQHPVSGEQKQVNVTLAGGAQRSGVILATDATTKLAIAKIEGVGFTPLPIADATPKMGDQVFVSHFEAFGTKADPRWIFSSLGVDVASAQAAGPQGGFQLLDVEYRVGSLGSPVLNSDGQVCGIYSMQNALRGYGTTPAAVLVEGNVLSRLLQAAEGATVSEAPVALQKGYMNVSLTAEGVVTNILFDSSNQAAAPQTDATDTQKPTLQKNDRITKINDRDVADLDDIYAAMRPYRSGDVIDVEIDRQGTKQLLSIKLQPAIEQSANLFIPGVPLPQLSPPANEELAKLWVLRNGSLSPYDAQKDKKSDVLFLP